MTGQAKIITVTAPSGQKTHVYLAAVSVIVQQAGELRIIVDGITISLPVSGKEAERVIDAWMMVKNERQDIADGPAE